MVKKKVKVLSEKEEAFQAERNGTVPVGSIGKEIEKKLAAHRALGLRVACVILGKKSYDLVRREPLFGDTGIIQTYMGSLIVVHPEGEGVWVVDEPNKEAYR